MTLGKSAAGRFLEPPEGKAWRPPGMNHSLSAPAIGPLPGLSCGSNGWGTFRAASLCGLPTLSDSTVTPGGRQGPGRLAARACAPPITASLKGIPQDHLSCLFPRPLEDGHGEGQCGMNMFPP